MVSSFRISHIFLQINTNIQSIINILIIVFYVYKRRISHRTHHQNHGHVENDESWVPVMAFSFYIFSLHFEWLRLFFRNEKNNNNNDNVVIFSKVELLTLSLLFNVVILLLQLPEKVYKKLDYSTKFLRFKIPFPMFAYPLYLVIYFVSIS